MRTILILGGGLTQCDAIATARRLALRVVVADANVDSPGMRLNAPEVIPIALSFADIDPLLAELEHRGLELDAVLPYGSDHAVLPAARIAERRRLIGIDVDAAWACTDKIEMRHRWSRAGVPTLAWAEVGAEAEAEREARAIGLPVVIKPPDNAAQRGVQLVTRADAVARAFRLAKANSPSQRVLIEQFVDGPELAVTTFTADGTTRTIQITDRITGPPPFLGICLAHVFPSALEPTALEQVERLLPRAAEALGVNLGPTYSQVRLLDGVPYVLETGARLGGGRDSELRTLLTSGQDAIEVHLQQLLGEPIDLESSLDPSAMNGGGCVRFLTTPPGRVQSIQGQSEAMASPGVRSVATFFHEGQPIPPLQNGAARAGYLIALGDNRAEAIDRAEHAAKLVRFVTSPPES